MNPKGRMIILCILKIKINDRLLLPLKIYIYFNKLIDFYEIIRKSKKSLEILKNIHLKIEKKR